MTGKGSVKAEPTGDERTGRSRERQQVIMVRCTETGHCTKDRGEKELSFAHTEFA